MNKKRIFTMLLAATLTAGTAVSASAAKKPEINVDFDNGIITISGEAADSEGVFLEVLNPGKNVEEVDMLTVDAFNHVEQIKATNGKYSFKYKLDGNAGIYTVLLKGSKDIQPWQKTFSFEISEITSQDLETLNGYIRTEDETSLKQFLEDNKGLYFEDALYYDVLSNEGKEQVAKGLIADGEMSLMADAKTAVIKYSVIQELYEVEADIDKGYLLKKYAWELDITDEAEYPFMIDEDEVFIENLGNRMDKHRLESYDEFLKEYKMAMCLAGVKNAENYGLIKGIIKRAVDSNIISVPKYMTLLSTENVDKNLVGKNFETVSEFEDEIERLASAIGATNTGNIVSGGAGGGSGHGNGNGNGPSSGVYMPSYGTIEKNKEGKIIFTDLDLNHWAYESVLSLNKLGALNGYEDGSFKGNNNVTRREFLKIALIAFDIQDVNAISKFNDVDNNDWAYKWIATAQTHGIINGDEKGGFNGDTNITRQDVAKILSAILAFKNYNIPSERTYSAFADDAEIADYAFDSVKLFYSAGVLNGMGDGTFRPKSPATRAESAKMIFSVLQRIGG